MRGELRVQPWCDSPEFFKKFKTLYYDAHGEKSVGVVCARPHGNIALLRLDGCDTVEKAASLRGKVYGTVTDVSQTGANDVWHITDDNGTETLIPAIPDVVSSVDVENGIVLITPLKGLFSDED